MVKKLSGKCTQKHFDHATIDVLKNALETAYDLIGNRFADRIMNTTSWSVLKPTSQVSTSKWTTTSQTEDVIPKTIYIPPQKRQQIMMNLD